MSRVISFFFDSLIIPCWPDDIVYNDLFSRGITPTYSTRFVTKHEGSTAREDQVYLSCHQRTRPDWDKLCQGSWRHHSGQLMCFYHSNLEMEIVINQELNLILCHLSLDNIFLFDSGISNTPEKLIAMQVELDSRNSLWKYWGPQPSQSLLPSRPPDLWPRRCGLHRQLLYKRIPKKTSLWILHPLLCSPVSNVSWFDGAINLIWLLI